MKTVKSVENQIVCLIQNRIICKARKKIPVFQVTRENKMGLVGQKKKFSFKTFFLNIKTSETSLTGFPSLTLCNIAALDCTHNLHVQKIAERNKTAPKVDQFLRIRLDNHHLDFWPTFCGSLWSRRCLFKASEWLLWLHYLLKQFRMKPNVKNCIQFIC